MLGYIVNFLWIMVGIIALMLIYVIAVIIMALLMSSRKKTPLPPTTTSGGLKQYLPNADWLKRPGAWCKNDLFMIIICLAIVNTLGHFMWPKVFTDWTFLIRVHLAFALFAWSSQIKSKPPRWGFRIAGVAILLWAWGHHQDPNWDGTPTAPTVWISSASAKHEAQPSSPPAPRVTTKTIIAPVGSWSEWTNIPAHCIFRCFSDNNVMVQTPRRTYRDGPNLTVNLGKVDPRDSSLRFMSDSGQPVNVTIEYWPK